MGNIVHNLFSVIDLLHRYSGGSLLIPKGRVYSLISNGPIVVGDDDNDTSTMATMIRHPLLLPILMRKTMMMGVRNKKKGNDRKREYFSSILHRDRYVLCVIVYSIFEFQKKKM